MKKTIISIIIVVVAGFAWVFWRGIATNLTEEPSADDIGKIAVNEVNKITPMVINKETRMDNASYFNKTITYSYTLVNTVMDDTLDYSQSFNDSKRNVKNKFCTTPELKIARDHGISNSYSYYDKNGVFMLKFTVNPEECE